MFIFVGSIAGKRGSGGAREAPYLLPTVAHAASTFSLPVPWTFLGMWQVVNTP